MPDIHAMEPRVPPHSIESESSVLGGLLLDNSAWDSVGDLLVDGDFYFHEHRLVFGVLSSMINANKPADVLTVAAEMERLGHAHETGWMRYLNSLAQYVPSASNIRRYAEIVRERSVLRAIIKAADDAQAAAYAAGANAGQAIESALHAFGSIDTRHGKREPRAVETLAVGLMDRLQALADGRVAPGVSTGLPTIDVCLGGGFKPGRQIVVAARPSVGKSSLAMQLAATVSRAGVPSLFLSQEMVEPELMDRLTAHLGRVQLDGIITGKLDDEGWRRVPEAVELMHGLPLYVQVESALTLSTIRAIARKAVRQHGIRVLVLDYIQLCAASAERSGNSRHHQLEELSRGLKSLAMELGLTTIVLSQLNRQVEQRTNGRPVLSDLKESGSIEEDADVVVLLSRDGISRNGTNLIHAEIAKSRGGRTGFCRLAFDGAVQHWDETTERVDVPASHSRGAQPPRKRYTNQI